jgi:CheY-like chemotaxis protein
LRNKETVRVLHVDDEEHELKFTKLFVEEIDPKIIVKSVFDPLEALELLRQEGYDLVLSDYQMKYMTGIDFTEHLRSFTDIPIIMYTGHGSEEVAEKAFKVGIDGYVRKRTSPSHYHHLAERMRKLVETYRTMKQPSCLRDSNLQFSLSM